MTKHKKLRHSEYYDLQDCFDKLYAKSKQGDVFTNITAVKRNPTFLGVRTNQKKNILRHSHLRF